MSEWIRFMDREPEIGQRIIVYEPNTKNQLELLGIGIYDGDLLYGDASDQINLRCVECEACGGDYNVSEFGRATHWMPAPVPPTMEE